MELSFNLRLLTVLAGLALDRCKPALMLCMIFALR